ncbi:MAG: FHA domain-containing protein [Lachnospiraceae bacterium]|nr:FHA domain-containing protein [Lachnospiraceae bacterium]
MNLTKCENDHIYDGDKFRSCPHCSNIVVEPILAAVFGEEQGEIDTNIPEERQQEHYERIGRRKTMGMLICIQGQMKGAGFLLKMGENVIGRASNMDVALVNEITISRKQHTTIWCEEESGKFFLDGVDGKAEVLCNGTVVKDRCALHDRDRITIGDCQLVFVEAGDVW